ncbi:hypothetical protein [Novosphingobium sp. CF614]|uniref:hypothetical protein n=1 Tax=Novosphingobium sp. CF614 TaxID=1884364 RepID=UPI000B82D11B|nr:hypothetical protein [Novosphingobium sp. CF614]
MFRHSNAVLKLSLALAALLAGGGIGFYYGIFLPSQEVRRQARELADKEAAAAAASSALAEQARRQQAAQAEYEDCVNFAELSYKQRWAQSCQNLHDADQSAYEDCADDVFSTEAGCRAKHPIRPEHDCALPAQVAQGLTGARDQRKAECLGRLQALQGGGARQAAPSAEGTGALLE